MSGSRGVRWGAGLAVSLGLLGVLAGDARAVGPQRSWSFLTTGNGHGFQVFDTNKNKIVSFLDHPYRYVAPRADPRSDGIGRRNLAFDVFFGVKASGGAGWLSRPSSAGDAAYVDESNIIHAPVNVAGVAAESYYFAPFGYEGNALIGLLRAPGATDGYALFRLNIQQPKPCGRAVCRRPSTPGPPRQTVAVPPWHR